MMTLNYDAESSLSY